MNVRLGRALDCKGSPAGPLRAWPGGLAVTRGIGDADCADIVSCEPACMTMEAPAEGGVLLACSDGVWDKLTADDITKILLSSKFNSPTHAAKRIAKKAASKNGLSDDTSVALLFFDAADAHAETSFLTEHIKPVHLHAYRPVKTLTGGGESCSLTDDSSFVDGEDQPRSPSMIAAHDSYAENVQLMLPSNDPVEDKLHKANDDFEKVPRPHAPSKSSPKKSQSRPSLCHPILKPRTIHTQLGPNPYRKTFLCMALLPPHVRS